jgi:hypothetical protein
VGLVDLSNLSFRGLGSRESLLVAGALYEARLVRSFFLGLASRESMPEVRFVGLDGPEYIPDVRLLGLPLVETRRVLVLSSVIAPLYDARRLRLRSSLFGLDWPDLRSVD